MPTIGLIVFPAFSPMNLGVTSVFETANWKLGSAEYEVTLLSEHGGPVSADWVLPVRREQTLAAQ